MTDHLVLSAGMGRNIGANLVAASALLETKIGQ